MHRKTFTILQSIKRMGGILFLIFSCFLTVGCSENEQVNQGDAYVPSEDKNITAIRAVIEQEFTGPNEEYMRLEKNIDKKLTKMLGNLPEGENGVSLPVDSPEWVEYNEFLKKTYEPYFMDYAYDSLISINFAFSYQFKFTGEEDHHFQMKVSDIEVNQEKEHPTIYRFTFQVDFENSTGKTTQHQLRGEAICPKEGKIGRINFQDTLGLLEEIKKDTGR